MLSPRASPSAITGCLPALPDGGGTILGLSRSLLGPGAKRSWWPLCDRGAEQQQRGGESKTSPVPALSWNGSGGCLQQEFWPCWARWGRKKRNYASRLSELRMEIRKSPGSVCKGKPSLPLLMASHCGPTSSMGGFPE